MKESAAEGAASHFKSDTKYSTVKWKAPRPDSPFALLPRDGVTGAPHIYRILKIYLVSM